VPDLLDTRLHDLLDVPDPEAPLTSLHRRARRRRVARRALAVGVVAVVLGAGAVLARGGDDDTSTDVHVGPPTDTGEAGWSELPMPPVVSITGAAWAGDQLVAWGPTEERDLSDGVFAYDEATGAWHDIRNTSNGIHATSAVWTGEQLIFMSHEIAPGVGPPTAPFALAWTPSTGAWEGVTPLPTPCADSPTWTGAYVVTACSSAGDGEQAGSSPVLYRLDVEEGMWVEAAAPPTPLEDSGEGLEINGGPPPLARLGDDVVLVAHRAGAAPEDPFAFVYDPEADEWADLPGGPVPLAPSDGLRGGSAVIAATATADGLLIVSGDRTAARYLEEEGRWEQLPEIPTRSTICLPSVVLAGDTPVADLCSGVAALGPDGTWTTTAYPSGELYGEQLPGSWLADDDAALLAGSSGLQRYRPPEPRAGGQIPFRSFVPLDDALLDLPDGAEVRSVEIVVPELAPNEDVFRPEEQLVADVVLADGAACTVTTGAAFRGDSRGVGVDLHGIDGSLSQSTDGSTVRWSWTPGTATWHQLQATCPTDEQALDLAEHVVQPVIPDL
jgi:hypothetical protein